MYEEEVLRRSFDIVILGGGIVGLSLAYQLIKHRITNSIIILDKERELGLHSSGRNSGVIHAGIYYQPKSLRAKVCVEGGKRLSEWILERNLPYNKCGKLIIPTKPEQDRELDLLKTRANENGAKVEMWDENKLYEFEPEVRSASGRALWSPNTAVVNPKVVIKRLQQELEQSGVKFYLRENYTHKVHSEQYIETSRGEQLSFGHLFNCTGLHADRISQQFGVGNEYSLLPFKGLYWQINEECPIKINTNIYPVPDLSVPFLGVHFTPSADSPSIVTIGPTATPAWGRENYEGIRGIETSLLLKNINILTEQYLLNRGNFRKYAHEQAFITITPLLVKAARQLLPNLRRQHVRISKKVAIRSQLFNNKKKHFEDDFLCLQGAKSTHILNAISPAFTASFALADLILKNSGFITTKS